MLPALPPGIAELVNLESLNFFNNHIEVRFLHLLALLDNLFILRQFIFGEFG